MKQLRVTAAFATLVGLVTFVSSSDCMAGDEGAIPPNSMTMSELRTQGIAVTEPGSKAFPNSCAPAGNPDLSVSNEMLAHFESRGFSLLSLCLGLDSHAVFDPETGRQLPSAFLPDIMILVPLNLPDCFKNAVPLLDCDYRYSHWEGAEFSADERADTRKYAQETDVLVRNYIERNAISGFFSIEAHGQGVFASMNWPFFASDALPHGYGYALLAPQKLMGHDPESEEKEIDLTTNRKKRGVSSRWSDEP